MRERKKYRAPVEKRSHEERYRALVGFWIRDGEGGWLNVKAGGEFTPPEQMNVRQHVELGEIEAVRSEVTDDG